MTAWFEPVTAAGVAAIVEAQASVALVPYSKPAVAEVVPTVN